MVVKRETYIVIQGWMRTDLNLSGNELLLFALIYGFCQREQQFTGSLNYMMSWLDVSKPTLLKLLQNLIERGLIRKSEVFKNNIKFCEYDVPDFLFGGGGKEILPPVNNFNQGSKEILPGVVKFFNQGGKKTLPNNTINNTINNSINNSISKGENFDPFFNNPIVDYFKKQYKDLIGSSLRIGTLQINKLIELYNDYADFTELVPIALKTAKKLKWDKCDPTNVFWILNEDNFMKLATGMYKVEEDASEDELNEIRERWLKDQQIKKG